MLNILLATLTEVISTEKDFDNGVAAEQDVNEAKKRFSQALNAIIDYRIQLAFDVRRRAQSQERIAVADSINSNVKVTASTIRSMAALSSAPPPPSDLSTPEELEKWKEEYTEWYENKRKAGVTIK